MVLTKTDNLNACFQLLNSRMLELHLDELGQATACENAAMPALDPTAGRDGSGTGQSWQCQAEDEAQPGQP